MELLIKNIRACDPQTGLDGITDIGIDGGKIVSLGKTDEHTQGYALTSLDEMSKKKSSNIRGI